MSNGKLQKIILKAPAKVNLFLHVTGKTENGYHSLQSLIAFTDLVDSIEITPSDNFQFTTNSQDQELTGNDNLVVRAAKTLSEAVNKDLNVAIHLTKNIPVGAGLGGGSSDAATTIKALIEYWDIREPENLQKLLNHLGADVPACYEQSACYVEGYGEIIHPIDNIPRCDALLIYPNIFCSTADIFKNYSDEYSKEIGLLAKFKDQDHLYDFLNAQQNDLTKTASNLYPDIKKVLQTISSQTGCAVARMSGSGSSCFGLFENKEQSIAAANEIQKERPDWFVRPVTLY